MSEPPTWFVFEPIEPVFITDALEAQKSWFADIRITHGKVLTSVFSFLSFNGSQEIIFYAVANN